MQGWWCVRNGDALAWVEAPSAPQALRRSLDLHALGDWTDDPRELVVFAQDAYPENAGPHDYTRAVLRATPSPPRRRGSASRFALTCVAAVAALGLVAGASAETWRGLTVAPEHRCAPYDKKRDYPYPQSVERDIVRELGAVYGPYTGTCFASTSQMRGGYREAGCATVSLVDGDGKRLHSVRMGRMPESNKATLNTMVAAEVEAVLAKRPDLTVVKLADGAKDNWTFLTRALPAGVELIDFYHAVEHLKDAFDTAHGTDSPKAAAQFKKYRHLLRHEPDGVNSVIRALVYLRSKSPGNERIAQVLGYFRGNRHRMRYADAKAQGLPIGSGVVEAACKTLVTERLKRSGMRWGPRGGQAILTLRSFVQSRRFDHAWSLLAQSYRTQVSCPDNVVPLRRANIH